MAKFKDSTVFPFTDDELVDLENEMKKYKVPWIYKIVFGSLYKWGKYFMPLIFAVILVLGLIHSLGGADLWNVIKWFSFFWIFGVGSLVAISWLAQRIKVLIWCKRLGITLCQWNLLTVVFQLKYV